MLPSNTASGPHAGQPVLTTGKPLGQSPVVVIMIHGRGAGPENILELAPALAQPDATYLAPAAANNTWYPYSFMSDIATQRAVLVVSAIGSEVVGVASRSGRHQARSHRHPGFLAGRVPDDRVRDQERIALRRCRGVQRRRHWATGNKVGRRRRRWLGKVGWFQRHADLLRLQRRRSRTFPNRA